MKSILFNQRLYAGLVVMGALLLSSCAAIKLATDSRVGAGTPASIAATDFATNLAAMLEPRRTRQAVYLPAATSEFGQALTKSLRRVGFTLTDVAHELAPTVAFEVVSLQTQQGASNEYRVTVGSLALSRTYVQDASGVYPATALITDVADGSGTTRTIDPFAALVDSSSAQTEGQGTTNGHAVVASSAVQVNSVQQPVALTPDLPTSLAGIERRNMYKTRESSFAEFTRGYKGVHKRILQFPNDSLAMTDDVMAELGQFAQMFRPGTDVLSVIGCSHGKTALDNGNALLAVGRSKRVRQYLVEQGVPVNRVLDEGCWAPVHFDGDMPRRGVVVELKRKSA